MCTKVSQGMTVAWEGVKNGFSRAGQWTSATAQKVADWAKPKWTSFKEASFNAWSTTKNWFVKNQGLVVPVVVSLVIGAAVALMINHFCCSKKEAAAPAPAPAPAPAQGNQAAPAPAPAPAVAVQQQHQFVA